MEPIPSETKNLLNEIGTLFRWHPEKNNLSDFAHKHPMKFYHEWKTKERIQCSACNKPIDGAMYCCDICKKFLHKSCAEFPRVLKAKFHRLQDPHDLQRFPDPDPELKKKKCSGCDLPIHDITTYGCQSCNVYLHEFCMELPENIKHPLHPSHPLSLNGDYIATGSSSTKNFCCKACAKDHRGLNYNCKICNFNLGLQCLVREATKPEGNQGHVLTLLTNYAPDDPALEEQCLACGRNFDSEEAAVIQCLQCQFSLHSECVVKDSKLVLPQTAYLKEEHRHALTLIESQDGFGLPVAGCDICDEWIRPNQHFYHCSDCEYDAHLPCAIPGEAANMSERQWPSSVQVSCHPDHLLAFTKSGSRVYGTRPWILCDICWRKVDPTLPFYACDQEDCDYVGYYVAHVICALRESNFSFAHKLDYGVLDTSPVVIKNPPLSVSDIINILTYEDEETLSDAIKAATAEKVPESAGNKSQNENHDHLENNGTSLEHFHSSNDEPFDQILKRFESKCRDQNGLKYYETQAQVTTVNDEFLIPKNLAPVLKALLSIYEDFSEKSTLSPQGKAIVFMVVCAPLYSICTTKEAEVSATQLFTCWDCFKIAETVGFKVEFAFNRLRKAMRAYFRLQDARASTDHTLSLLDEKMSALSRKMEPLQKNCAKRLTSVISNTIVESEIIEIVGDIEVTIPWHGLWDVRSLRQLLDLSEATTGESTNSEEVHTETQEMSSRDVHIHLLRDGSTNLVNDIKSFVENHPQRMSLSYLASKTYSAKEKKDRVHCYMGQEIVEDPTHGCINSNNVPELPGKILCDFHDHTLGLSKKVKDKSTTNKNEFKCYACGLPISYPAYCCAKCNIFLHEFCVQLPKRIDHVLHPSHPLSLQAHSKGPQKLTCNACGEKCRGCWFSCKECEFNLEIQCLFLMPTVPSQSHVKLLLYSEESKTNSVHGCFACGRKISRPPFLRCAACNVSLHVECAELPPTIKCAFDGQPITLTLTFPSSRNAEVFLDSFRCKLCAKQRNNPLLPIYYCKESKVTAHIDCVINTLPNWVEECHVLPTLLKRGVTC